MLTVNNTRMSFSHFIGNKEIINKLKLELLRLKGQRYVCKDNLLPYIDIEIQNIEKTIRFNEAL